MHAFGRRGRFYRVTCQQRPNEKEKGDEEADATAAAKGTEEISKEDVEIRRVIEERRNTPKEEKQRLKEVSKRKKCIRIKKN